MDWRRFAIWAETKLWNWLALNKVTDIEHTEGDSSDVAEAVARVLDERNMDTDIEWVWLDATYVLPSKVPPWVDAIVDLLPYRPERFDCEDYSFLYKTMAALFLGVNAVGVVIDWSGGHAYNIVVTSVGHVHFVEPQNGELVHVGKEEIYQFDRVLIII